MARGPAVLITLATLACVPRERTNADCRWIAETTPLPPGDRARRAHLLEDVRVAKDLGIRFADASAGRFSSPAWLHAQRWCTERSLTEIERVHRVSRPELETVGRARELWVDLLAVLLPVTVLFAVAGRAVAASVVGAYDREDRGVAAVVLAVLAPLAAGLAVGAAQVWGVLVEQLRVRNDHISYRAFELPASRHGWLLWGFALALFAGIGGWELWRRMSRADVRTRSHRDAAAPPGPARRP